MAKPPATAKVSDVIQNYQPARRFPNTPPTSITSLTFDDTGELLLLAQDDETLQIYNTTSGQHARELKSQKYGADLARFTHHPQSILYASTKSPSPSATANNAIRYLSTHDNAFLRYFVGHEAPVTSLSVNPGNDTFLSSALDNTVRIWDLRSQNATGILHIAQPLLTAYDATASVFAVACVSVGMVLLYDVRNFDKAPFAEFDVSEGVEEFERHEEVRRAGGLGQWTGIEFGNDGRRILVTTNGAGHIVLDAFEGEVVGICLRSSGGTGRVPPAELEKLRKMQQVPGRRPGSVSPSSGQGDACLTPDGKFVVGGAGCGEMLVWDIGREVEVLGDKVLKPIKELAGGAKMGSQNSVVACNPRFNLLAAADKNLVFWLPDME